MATKEHRHNRRLSCRIRYKVRWAVEDEAARRGWSITDIVDEALREWIERHDIQMPKTNTPPKAE